MLIIGLNGFKRSGKGTAADAISELLGTHVVQRGFADDLKVWAAKCLGYTDLSPEAAIALMDELKDVGIVTTSRSIVPLADDWKQNALIAEISKVISGREFLQNVGNEARQMFGDTFWIDRVLPDPNRALSRALGTDTPPEDITKAELESKYGSADTLLITDLRYPNEAERVRALGGLVYEIVRPGLASDGHASEQPLPRELVDETVENDGSVDDLKARLAPLVEKASGAHA